MIGRLTANPELRQTQSGVNVLSFTIAVDSRFANQNGERQANFIPCVAWRQNAEFISRYFSKGQWIGVEGNLQSRKYVDKNGNNRSILELVVDNASFCGSKSESGSKSEQPYGSTVSSKEVAKEGDSFSVGDLESVEGFEEIGTDDSVLPF